MIYDQIKFMSRNCAGGSGEVQIAKNNPKEGGLVDSGEVLRCALSVLEQIGGFLYLHS